MKRTPSNRIASGFDSVTGLPYVSEVTDSLSWPSESATLKALQTLVDIHNHGYEGLRFEHSRLNSSETLIGRYVNLSTPEGHLVNFVMSLAEHGIALPTEQAIGLLEKIYLSEGLPLPTPRSLTEQICLSEIEA